MTSSGHFVSMDADVPGYYDRGKFVVNCKLRAFYLVSCLSSRREGDGIKERIVIFARCKFHFITEHKNLV